MKKPASVLWISLLVALTLFSGAAMATEAEEVDPNPKSLNIVDIQASAVTWTPDTKAWLRIAGPDGYLLDREIDGGGVFYLYPVDDEGKVLADGLYDWHVAMSPVAPISTRTNLVDNRKRGLENKATLPAGEYASGSFSVEASAFVTATYEPPPEYDKDIVQLDDVIINGSACIGLDCANGESFGFDTLRLKENNLRLHFDDTSNTASFPQTDWRLIANETSNGGKNKFSIEDSTAGRIPFTVEGGAPANSLYVEDGGRIGFGTTTPVANLHVVEGNTPTLRLEQDGSNGFTPQTWDLAGNEANFFLRDATNGSRLPIQVKPSAPTASIFIAADGDVGIGTSAPSDSLHVRRTDGTTQLVVEEANGTAATRDLIQVINNGTAGISVVDSSDGDEWQFRVNGAANAFVITAQASGGTEFSLNRIDAPANGGRLTIQGDIVTGGMTCGGGCDAVFQGDFQSMEEQAEYMWENSHLPAVGPTSPNEPTNLTEKTGAMLTELEKAHIYIDQLNKTVKDLMTRIEQLEAAQAE